MGNPDQPLVLTAGSAPGDGFTLCWWFLGTRPASSGATSWDTLKLVRDASSSSANLVVGLGGEQLRVSFGSGAVLAREHGLTSQDDWDVPHHW